MSNKFTYRDLNIMALFLSESTTRRYNTQTLDEILIEGIELTEEFNKLNEAILRADYILAQRKDTLNESTYALQEANFISNAYAKVKEYAGKAWDWIVKYWNKAKAKAVEIYNRIKERVTGKGTELPKSLISKMQIRLAALEAGEKAISKIIGLKDSEAIAKFTADTTKTMNSYQTKIEEAGKQTGTVTVSPTYFDKLVAAVNAISTTIEKAASEAEKGLGEADKKNQEIADKANSIEAGSADNSEKSSHIATLKTVVSAVKEMVVHLSKFATAGYSEK